MRIPRRATKRRLAGAVLGVAATLVLTTVGPFPHGDHGLTWSRADAAEPTRPQVVDGDTVQTAEGVYDLFGIDAPELGQRCRRAGRWGTCGLDAAFALNRALGLALDPLVCTPVNDTERPRTATCAIGDKQDLAIVLLSQGLALALPDSPVRYKEAEESARAGGLGVWATDFVHPSDWRRGGRLPDELLDEEPACPIKAVVGDDGRRVYLVPLDPDYESVPDADVAARFCSDEAAETAGWMRPSLPEAP